MQQPSVIGLVAGNGRLPSLFAEAARARGLKVVAVGHLGETCPSLQAQVDALEWVKLGQLGRICRILRAHRVSRAVLAGGIGRVAAFAKIRPDLGALQVISRLRSVGDDALLRAVAGYFEERGVEIVSATELLPEVLAPLGQLAGPPPDAAQRRDLELGLEVATLLGRADVGQTAVVRNGHVMALEAIEGTDEAIRRGGRLGGPGACVVKLSKPGQDLRFDLPAVGPLTLEVMGEVGARLLAVEAGRTLLLEAPVLFEQAGRRGICLLGVSRLQLPG